MRSTTTSPKAPLERLAGFKPASTRRSSSSLLLGALMGASVAGLLVCLLVMRGKFPKVTALADCTTIAAASTSSDDPPAGGSPQNNATYKFATLAELTEPLPSAPVSLLAPLLHTPPRLPFSFWFVKTKKVGGSTLKGILNAICAHHSIICMAIPTDEQGESQGKWTADNGPSQIDKYRALGFEHLAITDHGKYSVVLAEYLNHPMLFTAVRSPVARFISQFFFVYCPDGPPEAKDLLTPASAALAAGEPIPQEVFDTMRTYAEHEANLVFKDICDKPSECTPADAVAPYDFIFVQEKFDESLVVFAIDNGLSFRDIAYTSAKNQTGKYPQEENLPSELIEFIKQKNNMDEEVYQLATDALDARIAALRDEHAVDPKTKPDFDALLGKFRALQAAVVAECSDHMQWYESHGFHDAYFYSNDGGAVGEGYRCIDFVARRFEAGVKE